MNKNQLEPKCFTEFICDLVKKLNIMKDTESYLNAGTIDDTKIAGVV